jgi:hypothetical protein
MTTQRLAVKFTLVVGLVPILWAGGAWAQQSGQEITQPSVAELARKAREEKAREKQKPAPVYTNETLPKDGGGISVVGPEPTPAEATEDSGAAPTSAKHDEKYFRSRMAELQHRLEVHQRELAVLQQKSSISALQYYPNPNEALQQQYNRADINKLNEQIEEKQKEIEADQQAITALEQQLRREGGDPGWLSGVTPSTGAAPAAEAAPTNPPSTAEEWQSRLGAARERLAQAKEEQQLAEDELNLLLTQQAREINTPAAAALSSRIDAKRAEVESKRTAADEAQRALDQLEQQFRESQGSSKPAANSPPDDRSPQ